jgi:hypothetical protein
MMHYHSDLGETLRQIVESSPRGAARANEMQVETKRVRAAQIAAVSVGRSVCIVLVDLCVYCVCRYVFVCVCGFILSNVL